MPTFAYDYRNQHTRGWCRGSFDDFNHKPESFFDAVEAVQKVALAWTMGTDFRVVTLADDGTEKFSDVAAVGNLAPMPRDK